MVYYCVKCDSPNVWRIGTTKKGDLFYCEDCKKDFVMVCKTKKGKREMKIHLDKGDMTSACGIVWNPTNIVIEQRKFTHARKIQPPTDICQKCREYDTKKKIEKLLK
jgi:hypothetical protein